MSNPRRQDRSSSWRNSSSENWRQRQQTGNEVPRTSPNETQPRIIERFNGRRVIQTESGNIDGLPRRNTQIGIWVFLCGDADATMRFGDYKGWFNDPSKLEYFTRKGWIRTPLFEPTSDDKVCERFLEKLQSIAGDIANCEIVQKERARLMVHFRIGDFYLFDRSFNFMCEPGPRLEDFNMLLDRDTFPDARTRLESFFLQPPDHSKPFFGSTFVTEKFCGSHESIEAFLEMRDFQANENEQHCVSTTLNGFNSRFELFFNHDDLKLQNITMITHKWNLDLVTAKGINYQGSFREVADFRLQFDASFVSDTTEKVAERLTAENFEQDELQQLFERVSDSPTADASDPELWEGAGMAYRLRMPHLLERIEYPRQQLNKSFVRPHERWPFVVKLRKFRFLNFDESMQLFKTEPKVQLRVTAGLDCQLDREVLGDPEFVSHLWKCCQLMQDLVAASLV